MAAFDMEEAARLGRSDPLPAGWTRFPVSRGALWANFVIYTVGAVLVFGLAVDIVITGSLPGDTPGDQGLAPFELIALLICGCVFLSVGLGMLPLLIKSQEYFFLITRQGFVYVAGKKLVGLPFTEIRSAYRQTGLLGGKLVVLRTTDKALVLRIGRFYTTRTVREMEEALIAALKTPERGKQEKRK